MHGDSRFSVTRTSAFHQQFTVVKSARHVIELFDSRQDTHSVIPRVQPFTMHLKHLVGRTPDTFERFAHRASPTQFEQRPLRLFYQQCVRRLEPGRLCAQRHKKDVQQAEHILSFHLFHIIRQTRNMAYASYQRSHSFNTAPFLPTFLVGLTHFGIDRDHIHRFPLVVKIADCLIDKCQVRTAEHLRFQDGKGTHYRSGIEQQGADNGFFHLFHTDVVFSCEYFIFDIVCCHGRFS